MRPTVSPFSEVLPVSLTSQHVGPERLRAVLNKVSRKIMPADEAHKEIHSWHQHEEDRESCLEALNFVVQNKLPHT